jgi:hypothetical protein
MGVEPQTFLDSILETWILNDQAYRSLWMRRIISAMEGLFPGYLSKAHAEGKSTADVIVEAAKLMKIGE